MNVGISLLPEFEKLYNMYATDPKKVKFLQIEGIAPNNLDIGEQSHDFFENKLADITTDSNSNYSENMNPTVYRTHVSNGQMKLLGYHLLYYYAMKRYGEDWANKAISMIWDGDLYFHDAHGLRIQMPYCYAFSIDKLVFEGRPYGSSPNTPPKRKKAFLSQVDKLISDLSKQFAGATAPSDLFLWYSWYLQDWLNNQQTCVNDDHNWIEHRGILKSEIIEDMQGLVCLFNEPGRAEGEPPFTNISIYDETGLQNLFGHITFPDHTKPDFEFIMFIQKTFCEWFSNGDPITGFPYRFPVVTINMTTGDDNTIMNKDFAKWVAHVDRNLGNFNLHFGSKSKIAMCCYSYDTEVLTDRGWIQFPDLHGDELFATVNIDTKDVEFQCATHNHEYEYDGMMHWYHDDKRKFDMMVTPNHEMLCVGGTGTGKRDNWKFIKSEEFGSSQALIRRGELFDGECDAFSKLVGFYIGDGYYDTTRHIVSFNLKKQRKIEYLLGLLDELDVKYKVGNRDKNGMTRIDILDNTILNVAYEMGKADSKYIPYNIYKAQMEVLAGTLDGLMNSDGNWDSNRFWTTSERLRDDVMAIACILGYQPWYTQFDREVELRGKQYHNDTYEIKLLTVEMLTHAKDRRDDVEYHDTVYCVDVPNHTIFVRRNGVASLSSNCRYENDLDDMNLSPDSFGNGGVNIGSHRVVTPNFAKAALLSYGNLTDFINRCDELIDVAGKLLNIHRKDILEKRINKSPEYLQFFGKLGWFSLDTMFSTIGITGIYEVNEFMGYDILDDDGTDFTIDFMSYLKGKIKGLRKEYGCTFNAEEIPGEQACVSLVDKDKLFIRMNDIKLDEEVASMLNECNLYSNQYIPLVKKADMITRLELSGRFMKMISGGGVVHINSETRIDSDAKMHELIKFIAKSGVPHCAVCYKFGKCEDHPATIVGQLTTKCPVCGKPITHIRERVIGYYSDVHNWHPRRQEFDEPLRYFSGEELNSL